MISIQCFLFSFFLSIQLTVAKSSVDIRNSNESNWIDEDWENRMLEIQNSIYLLSKSMVITSKIDQPVVPNPFYNRVNYIKYPNSMRATLLQISNDAYKSFLNVHSAVNQIHLYMQQVFRHVSKVTIVASRQMANRWTKNWIQIGEKCNKLIEESSQSFDDLRNLLNEILESENIVNATITTPLKSKKQRKDNARKRIRKPIKTTSNASTLCETMPQRIDDYYGLVSIASKSLLSVSKKFLDGKFPLPRLFELMTQLKNFSDIVNDVSNGSPEEFTDKSHDLLYQSFSIVIQSKTYFKISQKFMMPRLAGLSLMLTSITDDDRKSSLKELCQNQTIIDNEIKRLIKEERRKTIGIDILSGRTQ